MNEQIMQWLEKSWAGHPETIVLLALTFWLVMSRACQWAKGLFKAEPEKPVVPPTPFYHNGEYNVTSNIKTGRFWLNKTVNGQPVSICCWSLSRDVFNVTDACDRMAKKAREAGK